MIKNIIFDFGGVVVPLNAEEGYRRFEALGIKDASLRLGKYGQTGIFLECEKGEIDVPTFQRKVTELAHQLSPEIQPLDKLISFDQCKWAWCGYVTEVRQNRLENLLSLKEKYNVILLSNTNPFIMDWADSELFSEDGHPLSYYFHRVFYSYKLKDYKPSPTIFQKVLEKADINASETLFLDDSAANIESAKALGIHGLLVPKNEDWMDMLTDYLRAYES
jgi:putative hydrolase of the HAD superfamily